MDLLIKGARIVDHSQDFTGDVYIRDGIIAEIGLNINKGCRVLQGEGLILLPAFVDLHAHFRDPGLTYKEDILTGSQAAVKGGYTTVNLMANTKPVCSSIETVDYVLRRGRQINLVDIHQTVSITENLEGRSIEHLNKFNVNTNGVDDEEKVTIKFISDDGRGVSDSKVMLKAMLKAKEKNITIISHAESPELSDIDMRLAENTMTWRDITLSKFTGCKLHMAHVSTMESMEYIIAAKRSGHKITCEVTPHHLALNDEVHYKVNPPLRKEEDIRFLIKAIKDGYVDAIATDHAPHTVEDKRDGAPGISGIETSFSVCYTALVKSGEISLKRLSELMSKSPSEIMGINKGKISIGFEGDLVLVDINKVIKIDTENFISKGKNSPFEGNEVYGEVLTTIKGGRIVYQKE